jgi:hypothetical protein
VAWVAPACARVMLRAVQVQHAQIMAVYVEHSMTALDSVHLFRTAAADVRRAQLFSSMQFFAL